MGVDQQSWPEISQWCTYRFIDQVIGDRWVSRGFSGGGGRLRGLLVKDAAMLALRRILGSMGVLVLLGCSLGSALGDLGTGLRLGLLRVLVPLGCCLPSLESSSEAISLLVSLKYAVLGYFYLLRKLSLRF